MNIAVEGAEIVVTRPNDDKENRSLHGLTRTLIHNMIVGVTEGFKKELEVNGVGYRVQKQGTNLVMNPRFLASGHRSGNGRDQDRSSGSEQDHHQWHRQAEGRPVRSGSPREETAGAVQGQGHQVH